MCVKNKGNRHTPPHGITAERKVAWASDVIMLGGNLVAGFRPVTSIPTSAPMDGIPSTSSELLRPRPESKSKSKLG
jgi:hypothetical protein